MEPRDFAAGLRPAPRRLTARRVPGWRAVQADVEHHRVRIARGVRLDLGATAKALAADRAALRAALAAQSAGVLVNLGTTSERNRTQDQLPLGEDADPGWARVRVQDAARGMGGAVFRATPGVFCRVCATRTSCPANDSGRQVTE